MRIYFSYLGETEAFDPTAHARQDEYCFSVSVRQVEERFPVAMVEIEARPGGYLKLGRRVALSCEHDGQVWPLIVGTITGAPLGLLDDVVTLEITGRGPGWQRAQRDLIESAAVAPRWDPLFAPRGG